MRKKSFLVLLTATIFVLSGCGNAHNVNNDSNTVADSNSNISMDSSSIDRDSNTTAAENVRGADILTEDLGNEVVFTDALGRQVGISNPKRVVTLLGSFCDEWMLAGGNVVGTASDSFTSFDLGLDESVVDVGTHLEPDIEKIIASEPDFVVASSMMDSQIELLDTLENAGITVAYFYVNSFDDYLETLDIFTQITGRADLYEKYGTEVAEQVEAAKAQADGSKPTVLFIRAAASSVKVKKSKGTVGGEILADLDTVNIADSDSLFEELSMEAVILADPDYIFVTTQGYDTETALENVQKLLIDNPAWQSLKAVKNGNYYVLDKALYNSKPNARWGEAYKKLADILYEK